MIDAKLFQATMAESHEVTDAFYRFGAGVDLDDLDLLASAFEDEAEVDFGPCGRKMGLDLPPLTGSEMILRFLSATPRTQTTTHVITNGQAHVEGNAAMLRALVNATHLQKDDHSRRCQMMNWYAADLVKAAGLWRIRRLVIDSAWFTGDPQVLLGR